MNTPWIYTLLLGLSIFAASGTGNRPGSGPQPATATVAAAAETWTIPGAGRTPGQNNTFFVSDLALTNLGSATANVTIAFVGPGGLPAKPITIAAGSTTAFRDIVNALWSATGLVGALSVESDQPLVVRARTYNTAASGTFGVALPVFRSGDLLDEGGTADSIWVEQSPSASSGFRTNVGVVFPDAGGGEAVVTFFDAVGSVAGSLTYSAVSAGFQQQSSAGVLTAGLPVGRAQISVTRGQAAGYAVGVDNVTGDTSLYPFEALPAGVQDVVVSGVARLTGRNNTFFRTDARFYNPTAQEATVTASFHAAGTANPTPQSATLSVPAGRLVEVVDVLDSVLHLPVGSGGAVRFTSDQPVAVLARTSNVDPQGVQPGTFGAQQKPVLVASYLSSADAGAAITAIRQDASYRTNVGFAAGPDGAAYALTLKNAQGGVVAVTTGSLGTFGWAQPSIADLFPGTAIPADATLLVQVTSGTIAVYDASLDNASGDLVVTAIAPVPVAIPSSALIGPAGGSVRSADGRLALKVPAGALATATTLSISPVSNTAPNAIGSAYALSPVGLAFARPAQVVLAYSGADLAGTGAGAVGIASLDGTTWYAILGGAIDTNARTLFVPVSTTSPGPSSPANAHVAQRASATGHLGAYGSVRINPDFSSVEEEGRISFSTVFSGPSSTSSAIMGLVGLVSTAPPRNVEMDWFVDQVHLGNDVVGTIDAGPPPRHVGDYYAPRCAPARIIPILITAEIPGGPSAVIRLFVRVIPRRWDIDLVYKVEHTCAAGWPYSFELNTDHGPNSFSIRDSRVENFSRGGFQPTRGRQPAAWCPGVTDRTDCSQPQEFFSGYDRVEVIDVVGVLTHLQGTLNPRFDLTITARFPDAIEYRFTCPTCCPQGSKDFKEPVLRHVVGLQSRALDPPISYPQLTWSLPPTGLGESVEVKLTPRYCP